MSFADRLRKAREKAGLTQAAAAERINMKSNETNNQKPSDRAGESELATASCSGKASDRKSYYGVVLHCSPPPKEVIGYFYPDGFTGRRVEQWRIPYDERQYRLAARIAKRTGGGFMAQDNRFYDLLKPTTADRNPLPSSDVDGG